ncbi:hypothetical protein OAM99_04360 [Planktomarina sp.]|nr:hypothetical protein [Planktomarina sp.]
MTIQQHASFDSSAAELNATSKLVKAWESKNAKNAAKAGGISLMALSLAACGGSTTPVAVVDTTPVVDPAVTAAEAAQAAAEAAKATAEAAQAAAEAELAAALNPTGKTVAMTTSSEVVNGTAGNDAVTATSTTYTAGDVIVDSSASDSDTLVVTATDDISAAVTVAGIENMTFNLDAVSALGNAVGGNTTGFDVNADQIANGTITVAVTKAASPVATAKVFNVGDGVTVASDLTLTVAGDANANITINATKASSQTITAVTGTIDDLTINGSAATLLTITDADAEEDIVINNTGGVTVTDITAATDNASIQTMTISAGGAVTITDYNNLGSVTASTTSGNITADVGTANKAITLSTDAGNVTVSDAEDTTTTLTVTAVGDGDDTATATAADGDITVTAASLVETVTLNATGDINLDDVEAAGTLVLTAGQASNIANTVSDVQSLTLASNKAAGAAVVFTATAGDGGTDGAADGFAELDTITFSGSNSVTLDMDASDLVTAAASTDNGTTAAAVVATDSMTGGTSRIEFFADGGGAAINLRSLAVDEIALDVAANGGDSFLMNSGQNLIVAADQTADLALTLPNTPGNTATVTIENDAAAGAVNDLAGITTTTVGTLTIAQNDAASTAAPTTGAINVGATNNVVVTGGKLNVSAAVTAASFDASAATGAITISATNATTSFKTGSGNDTFTSAGATKLTIDGGAGSDTVTFAAADYSASTVSLTSIETLDITNSGVSIAASAVTGGSYVISGDAAADTLNVKVVAAVGEVVDLSGTATTGVVTLTGLGGTDTLTGSSTTGMKFVGAAGADTIVGGSGVDTVTFLSETGAADTITLGGGSDVLNQAATAATTMAITKVTDMNLGTASTAADTFNLSLTAIEGLTTTTDLVDSSAVSAIATDGTIVKVTTDGGTIASADLVILSQSYASDTAALNGMKTTGSDTITYGAALTDNDSFLVAYSDGTNLNIAVATTAGGTLTTSEGLDSVATILQFTGISSTENLDSTDFAIIA